MAEIRLSRIKSSAFKISSYVGPSVFFLDLTSCSLVFRYGRPMVIDRQKLNLSPILPIYLRLPGNVPPPPPGRDHWWKVALLYIMGSHQPFSLEIWWSEDLSLETEETGCMIGQ